MAGKRTSELEMHLTITRGALVILFLLGLFLGLYLPREDNQNITGDNTRAASGLGQTPQVVTEYIAANGGSTFATIGVPAVDEQGNGVVTTLSVQVNPGSGKILTDIDKLFFWVDTQNSIKTATKVAQDATKTDLSRYDIVYTVRANASVIEGGSAGAALTLVTIAALKNKTLNNSVMITGTINEDGRIGPIGEVVAKAIAAKDIGAKLFLVPQGQGSSRIYKPERKCYTESDIQVCETKTTSEKISIAEDIGIEVREVRDIKEAMKYFSL